MNAGRLHKLARVLRQLAAEVTSDSGDVPSGAELLVGIDLFTHTPTSIGEIAARTGVVQSQVSGIVAQMRSAGLVISHADPHDGRRTVLSLTPEAQTEQGIQRGRRDPRAALQAHLDRNGRSANDSEIEEILALLDLVSDRLAVS